MPTVVTENHRYRLVRKDDGNHVIDQKAKDSMGVFYWLAWRSVEKKDDAVSALLSLLEEK
jgi:hypothetical protein